MAFEVPLLVTFPCSDYEGVAALARKHLPALQASFEPGPMAWGRVEAVAFLTELAERNGPPDRGPKNGLAAWAYGGNHTRPDTFAEALRPFWEDLLRRHVEGGPFFSHHVVVLYQLESSEHIDALEVFIELPPGNYHLTPPESRATWPLVIRKHEGLPFRWR